jgi:hypothetical protein
LIEARQVKIFGDSDPHVSFCNFPYGLVRQTLVLRSSPNYLRSDGRRKVFWW